MDDSTIFILIFSGVTIILLAFAYRTVKRMVGNLQQAEAAEQQIIQQGITADATILDVWETGVRHSLDNDPQLGLRLTVAPPNQTPYEAEIKIMASPLQLVQLQPGQTITVHIDPADPHNIILPPAHPTITNLDDLSKELL
ncbi:hypothetical protein [Candidatus Leptofilum sp.]|uniref:hypothetical protein n=1 Tax=Candidatus Leptofilum sp. TaxID=3241576 RepID=UPI003B5A1B24